MKTARKDSLGSQVSATRSRIDNDQDGAHDEIFPNHDRGANNSLHIS